MIYTSGARTGGGAVKLKVVEGDKVTADEAYFDTKLPAAIGGAVVVGETRLGLVPAVARVAPARAARASTRRSSTARDFMIRPSVGVVGGKPARMAGILGGALAGFVIAGNSGDSNRPNLTLRSGHTLQLQLGEDLTIN